MQNIHGAGHVVPHPASVAASAGQPPPPAPQTQAPPTGHGNPELSFEDFTSMSPFLDPAALHGLNPYASSLASSAAAASSGEFYDDLNLLNRLLTGLIRLFLVLDCS